jgi:hypothetical protein
VVAFDERGEACTWLEFANVLAMAGMSRCPFYLYLIGISLPWDNNSTAGSSANSFISAFLLLDQR